MEKKPETRLDLRLRGYLTWSIIFLTTVVILVLSIRYFGYGSSFRRQRENTVTSLRQSAREAIAGIARTVEENIAATGKSALDSLARARRVQEQLNNLATQLEQLAVADRSNSLDYVFDVFSTLLAVAALLLAGIGVFTGLKFREVVNQVAQLRREIETVDQKLARKVSSTKDALAGIANQGSDIIWAVANGLEKMINTLAIDQDAFSQIMTAFHRTAFRTELFSPNQKERIGSLHFLYAQGTCDDLSDLYGIMRDGGEPAPIQNLARRAFQAILTRCPHGGHHPELDLPVDGKPN